MKGDHRPVPVCEVCGDPVCLVEGTGRLSKPYWRHVSNWLLSRRHPMHYYVVNHTTVSALSDVPSGTACVECGEPAP